MAAPGPVIGALIGDYRVLAQLGEGGMGVVYLAEDVRLGRKVALKTLAPEFARDPERRKRFLNEARAAAALSHPAVAAVYELEERGEDVFIIFEYVEGTTLRALVATSGMSLAQLLEIATQVASALEAAHGKGIVHRDLKPENVMLAASGLVKVLDFGLARFDTGVFGGGSTTQSFGLTQAGTVMGTVGYMSPEQLEGKATDFRSDIFSFGVLLYELASGTHPFAGETPASTIANVMTQEPPPLTAVGALHPAELQRIVRKCMRKSRDERYQSTRDLLVDLKSLKHDSSGTRATVAPAASGDRSQVLTLAAIQALFAVPYGYWGWLFGQVMGEVAGEQGATTRDHVLMGAMVAFVSAGFLLCATSAIELVRVPQDGVRRMSRLRYLYVTAGILSALLAGFQALRMTESALSMLVVAAAGVLLALYAGRTARELAPPEAATKSSANPRSPHAWWIVHQFANLLLLAPWVVYWSALTRDYFGVVSRIVFLLLALLVGVKWSLRFVLICMWTWNRAALAAQNQRFATLDRYVGLGIVSTMLVEAGMAAAKDQVGFAAAIGAFAMGGLVSVLYIEPALVPPAE